jgi:hypothetical protein
MIARGHLFLLIKEVVLHTSMIAPINRMTAPMNAR